MTATTSGTRRGDEPATPRPSLVIDSLALGGQHLRMMSRRPASIIGALVLPVIFAVLFLTVFGRVMDRAGIDYAQFMVPAIVRTAPGPTPNASTHSFTFAHRRGSLHSPR